MRIPTLLAVCVFSLSAGTAACQEAVSGTDTVIAVSFKTLAKALVAQDGIQRLTSRIETMDDAEFSVRYKEAYGMLVSVPGLQSSYGLKKGLSRKEMLAVLKTWDGRKVCALIDSVPDAQVSAKSLMVYRDGNPVFGQPGALPEQALENVLEQVRGLDMDAVRSSTPSRSRRTRRRPAGPRFSPGGKVQYGDQAAVV